jgi:serine protease Do
MSGGPAILNNGKVVGINVSSAGNQVSFLVPVKYALNLYQSSKGKKDSKQYDFIKSIRDQLYSNQDAYYQNLLNHSTTTMSLGKFKLTNQLSTRFKCWGDLEEENEKQLFTLRSHTCFSRDDIYISKAFITNKVEYQHLHISAGKLNRFRFYSLLSKYMGDEFYQNDNQSNENQFIVQRKKLLTNFKCQTATIDQSGNLIRTVFCLRAYKLFEGLYDAVFKTVPLDQKTESVISTLYLPSISFDNSQKMAGRFLSEVSWTEK